MKWKVSVEREDWVGKEKLLKGNGRSTLYYTYSVHNSVDSTTLLVIDRGSYRNLPVFYILLCCCLVVTISS